MWFSPKMESYCLLRKVMFYFPEKSTSTRRNTELKECVSGRYKYVVHAIPGTVNRFNNNIGGFGIPPSSQRPPRMVLHLLKDAKEADDEVRAVREEPKEDKTYQRCTKMPVSQILDEQQARLA